MLYVTSYAKLGRLYLYGSEGYECFWLCLVTVLWETCIVAPGDAVAMFALLYPHGLIGPLTPLVHP